MSVSGHMNTRGAGEDLAPLRQKSGWLVALGVLYLIAGVLALGSILTATVISVFFVGIMMIVVGVGEIFGAFQVKSWGKFFLLLAIGVLYIIAGIAAFENPALAAVVLTFVLGIALVVSGIVRIVLAFAVRPEQPWLWILLSGLVTLVLGIIILARWPVSSVYVLGLFLGVDLVIAGIGWLGLGLGLGRSRRA